MKASDFVARYLEARGVTHTFELTKDYVCGLCEPPARAGKGKAQITTAPADETLH